MPKTQSLRCTRTTPGKRTSKMFTTEPTYKQNNSIKIQISFGGVDRRGEIPSWLASHLMNNWSHFGRTQCHYVHSQHAGCLPVCSLSHQQARHSNIGRYLLTRIQKSRMFTHLCMFWIKNIKLCMAPGLIHPIIVWLAYQSCLSKLRCILSWWLHTLESEYEVKWSLPISSRSTEVSSVAN